MPDFNVSFKADTVYMEPKKIVEVSNKDNWNGFSDVIKKVATIASYAKQMFLGSHIKNTTEFVVAASGQRADNIKLGIKSWEMSDSNNENGDNAAHVLALTLIEKSEITRDNQFMHRDCIDLKQYHNYAQGENFDYFPKDISKPQPEGFREKQIKALSILIVAFCHSISGQDLINSGNFNPESGSFFSAGVRSSNQEHFTRDFHQFLNINNVAQIRAQRIINVFNQCIEVVVKDKDTIICAFKDEAAKINNEIRGIGILFNRVEASGEASFQEINLQSNQNSEPLGWCTYLINLFNQTCSFWNLFSNTRAETSSPPESGLLESNVTEFNGRGSVTGVV